MTQFGYDYEPPEILRSLVARVTYKKGYKVSLCDPMLAGSGPPHVLTIRVKTEDSENRGREVEVCHIRAVPMRHPQPDDPQFWRRWLMEQFIAVERHEAMEFFEIDGVAPFFPPHGGEPGDPYAVREREDYQEPPLEEQQRRLAERVEKEAERITAKYEWVT